MCSSKAFQKPQVISAKSLASEMLPKADLGSSRFNNTQEPKLLPSLKTLDHLLAPPVDCLQQLYVLNLLAAALSSYGNSRVCVWL